MGKSNRIRSIRATERNKTLGVKNKNKGMPSWAMSLITVVVAVALLLSVASILLSANGVFTRMTTVIKSENYKVNSNMMSYYYGSQYQNFLSTYGNYGTFSLKTGTGVDVKDQKLTADDISYLGMFGMSTEGVTAGQSWYDYFMKNTVESVKSMLIYCEASSAEGINVVLTDKDYSDIDASIESYQETAAEQNYPNLNSFFSAYFGAGVSEGDVRKCMEYSLLATKTMEKISEILEGDITTEEINAKYEGSKKDFNVIDYSYYTFSVNYSDILKEKNYTEDDLKDTAKADEVLKAYKEAIAKARKSASELKAITDLEQFKAYIYKYVAEKTVEEQYGKLTFAEGDKDGVTDGDITVIKAAIVADVLEEIKEGKEKGDVAVTIEEGKDTYKVYEKDGVKKAFAEKMNTLKEKVFSSVYSATTTYNVEKAKYVEKNVFSEWAFNDARKQNDIEIYYQYDGALTGDAATMTESGKIEVVDDPATDEKEDSAFKKENGYSYVTVYYLTKTQEKDLSTARNFSYIVFGKEEDAKAAIAAVSGGELTKDAFLAKGEEYVAAEKATVCESIKNYEEGTGFAGTDLDTWVYDAATVAGTVTTNPIKITEESNSVYVVAFYEGEGDQLWFVDVKNSILVKDTEEKKAELDNTHPVTVNDKRVAKVNTVSF